MMPEGGQSQREQGQMEHRGTHQGLLKRRGRQLHGDGGRWAGVCEVAWGEAGCHDRNSHIMC
jgi:hypothetical protein